MDRLAFEGCVGVCLSGWFEAEGPNVGWKEPQMPG